MLENAAPDGTQRTHDKQLLLHSGLRGRVWSVARRRLQVLDQRRAVRQAVRGSAVDGAAGAHDHGVGGDRQALLDVLLHHPDGGSEALAAATDAVHPGTDEGRRAPDRSTGKRRGGKVWYRTVISRCG